MLRASLTQMLPNMMHRNSVIPCDQKTCASTMVVSQKWGPKHRCVFGDQRSRSQKQYQTWVHQPGR